MRAIVQHNAIRVLSCQRLPGEICITTACADYGEWQQLPDVVHFNGELFTKTGWNSDHHVAYYKTGGFIAWKGGAA